jgi:hypothetical protein
VTQASVTGNCIIFILKELTVLYDYEQNELRNYAVRMNDMT